MRTSSITPKYLSAVWISAACFFLLTSCVSQRDVTYFQPLDPTQDVGQMATVERFVVKIQPGDILSVMVSSLSAEASTMFNPYLIEQSRTIQNSQTNNLQPAHGYLIDENGVIKLPLLGSLKIGGLSTLEATRLITDSLSRYLQEPTVNIRILNFRISVMGEVVRPSVYTVPNERITLPEAISLAGDMTIYGKRNNVMVIREIDGKREFARIDMTKRDIFTSPYFYLHPNDMVYVEPTKGKVTSSDRTIQLAPIIISGLSLLAVIITNITR